MPDFIDLEIERHCPNPRPRSAIMVDAMPLVLWQIFLLAEDDCRSPIGVMRSPSSLADAACAKLTKAGMIVGEGDLVRKVCGPLLLRHVSLHISRRYKDVDDQRRQIRARAETVFRNQLERLLTEHFSVEAAALIDRIKQGELDAALYSGDASALVSDRVRSAAEVAPAIKLGRRLF